MTSHLGQVGSERFGVDVTAEVADGHAGGVRRIEVAERKDRGVVAGDERAVEVDAHLVRARSGAGRKNVRLEYRSQVLPIVDADGSIAGDEVHAAIPAVSGLDVEVDVAEIGIRGRLKGQ